MDEECFHSLHNLSSSTDNSSWVHQYIPVHLCPQSQSFSELWIVTEDAVRGLQRSGGALWSSGSSAFLVLDHSASYAVVCDRSLRPNRTAPYYRFVKDAATLLRFDWNRLRQCGRNNDNHGAALSSRYPRKMHHFIHMELQLRGLASL